jgi:ribosomal protein L37AE/L43A
MKFLRKIRDGIKQWLEEQVNDTCSKCHKKYVWNPNYYIWECDICGERQK